MLFLLKKIFIGFHLVPRETAVGTDICYILSCLVGYFVFFGGSGFSSTLLSRVKVNLSVRTITFLGVNAVEYRIQSWENSGIVEYKISGPAVEPR